MTGEIEPADSLGGSWGLDEGYRRIALLVIVLTTIALAYQPGLGGGFAFDDYPNIVLNTRLRVTALELNQWIAAVFSSPAKELPRPLSMLSFAINHYFTGLRPWPMKATNLSIHLVNTLLVYALSRSLIEAVGRAQARGTTQGAALFIAACWGLFPINLMPILLVVQRMELLSHTFVFFGLWLYVTGRLRQVKGGQAWGRIFSGLLVCTGLGILSKESAALLPLYALLIEVLLLKFELPAGIPRWSLLMLYCIVLVIPAGVGLAWLLPTALNPGSFAHRNFNLVERLLTEPRVVIDYLRWTLLPDLSQLSLFHDDYLVSRGFLSPKSTLPSTIFLAFLILVCRWLGRSRQLAAIGLAWFLAAQLLTATIVPLELVFEHRNYFASLGVALILGDFFFFSPVSARNQAFLASAALLLLIFYGIACHLRALEWSNPLRFATTEAIKHPNSPRATYNLAQTFAALSEGRANSPFTPAAFAAFERARRAPGSGIAPSQGALLLAARTGAALRSEWWSEIQDRLRSRPIGAQELGAMGALTNCAISTRCHFPPEEMLAMYGAALSRGDNPEALNIYGNYALNVLGDTNLAERLWREASRLSPQEPEYIIGLAKLMMATGQDIEAEEEIRRLRSIGHLGQYDNVADSLEARHRAIRQERNANP